MTCALIVGKYCLAISTHTPTRGVTPIPKSTSKKKRDFNSHAHEGRDVILIVESYAICISTHTPTRGVTKLADADLKTWPISTHTPTRGVT